MSVSTISINNAVLSEQPLSPETPLLRDVASGLVLTNERLLGGEVLTQDDPKNVFDDLLQNAALLKSTSKDKLVETCKMIRAAIESLTLHSQSSSINAEEEIRKSRDHLLNNQNKYVETQQTLSIDTRNLSDAETRLTTLHTERDDLIKAIDDLNSEIESCKRKIQVEEKKREDGKRYAVPVIGVLEDLFTGHPNRINPMNLIPGYAAIEGIISQANKEKEDHESLLKVKSDELEKLKMNIDLNEKEVELGKEKISFWKGELSRLDSENNMLDKTIEKAGQRLTVCQNHKLALGKIKSQYDFIKEDIVIIEALIDADSLDLTNLDDFTKEITDLKESFFIAV